MRRDRDAEGKDEPLERATVDGAEEPVDDEGGLVADDGLQPPLVEVGYLQAHVLGIHLATLLGCVAAREEKLDRYGEAPRALVDDEVGPVERLFARAGHVAKRQLDGGSVVARALNPAKGLR